MRLWKWIVEKISEQRQRKKQHKEELERCKSNRGSNLKLLWKLFEHAPEGTIVVVDQNSNYCSEEANQVAEMLKRTLLDLFWTTGEVMYAGPDGYMTAFIVGKITYMEAEKELSMFGVIDRYWVFEQPQST